jgi:uncharacterized iron-regulated membrane protein
MLLLIWVAITGTLLALDELFVPAGLGGPGSETAPGVVIAAVAAPKPGTDTAAHQDADYLAMRLRTHNLLKRLHTGAIVGLSGEALDLLTGLAFVTLATTGILMYFELLRARRRSGRRRWFWR